MPYAARQRTGFGDADPALTALLDASAPRPGGGYDFLAQFANIDPNDPFGAPAGGGFPERLVMPLALGAIALGALLLLAPSSGRRR